MNEGTGRKENSKSRRNVMDLSNYQVHFKVLITYKLSMEVRAIVYTDLQTNFFLYLHRTSSQDKLTTCFYLQ